MEGQSDIVIKKATMIKKNEQDINAVYTVEKGVRILMKSMFDDYLIRNLEVDLMALCIKEFTKLLDKREPSKSSQEPRSRILIDSELKLESFKHLYL